MGTFGVVLVQLVGGLLPVLDAVLEGTDQALHQSAATKEGKEDREVNNGGRGSRRQRDRTTATAYNTSRTTATSQRGTRWRPYIVDLEYALTATSNSNATTKAHVLKTTTKDKPTHEPLEGDLAHMIGSLLQLILNQVLCFTTEVFHCDVVVCQWFPPFWSVLFSTVSQMFDNGIKTPPATKHGSCCRHSQHEHPNSKTIHTCTMYTVRMESYSFFMVWIYFFVVYLYTKEDSIPCLNPTEWFVFETILMNGSTA